MKITPFCPTDFTSYKPVAFQGFPSSYEEFAAQKPYLKPNTGKLPGCETNSFLASNVKRRKPIYQVKKEIQEVLDVCRYSKAPILDNTDRLKITKEDGKYCLSGFLQEEDSDGTITGICQELSYKAGKILQEKFKDDYIVCAVFVEGTKYNFSGHTCLLMIERTPKTEELVETRAELTTTHESLEKLKKMLAQDPDNKELQDKYDALKEKGEVAVDKIHKLTEDTGFLDKAILVDPSLNFMCTSEEFPDNYIFTGFNTLDGMNPYEQDFEHIMEPGHFTPLGFVEELLPELKDRYPGSIVGFGLSKDCKNINASIFGGTISGRITKSTLEAISPNNKLIPFIDKLNKELQAVQEG